MKEISWLGAGLILAAATCLGACGDDAPDVPHAVTSLDRNYCLGCHETGANGAPKTPHPDRDCTTCHHANNYTPPVVDAGAD